MLLKATEDHRESLLEYLTEEPSINIFIIGDIERFGFDSDFQEVWIQTGGQGLSGVVLRYHDNFILYTKTVLECEPILALLETYEVGLISGKAAVIDQIYPLVSERFDYKAMNFAELTSTESLSEDKGSVKTASEADALAIATAYGHIEEFKQLYSSSVSERCKQIENRIKSGEGTHVFITENDRIVCHGNTAAQTDVSAMIGGVMTLPGYRRRGLARQVVSRLCSDLISQGKTACLFYNGIGPESLFMSLGFKEIDKWIVLGGKP